MAEPTTTTFVITGIIAAALGPVLGPWCLIAFGATAGSLLSMGKTPMPSAWAAAWFVVVGIAVATAITGAAAWALETYAGVPANVGLMPIAAVIGAGRNALLGLVESLFSALANLAGRKGAGQ